MREKTAGLNHIAHASAQRDRIALPNVFAVDLYDAGSRLLHTVNQLKRCCFTAAAFSDNTDGFGISDFKIEVVDGDDSLTLGISVRLRNVFQFYQSPSSFARTRRSLAKCRISVLNHPAHIRS